MCKNDDENFASWNTLALPENDIPVLRMFSDRSNFWNSNLFSKMFYNFYSLQNENIFVDDVQFCEGILLNLYSSSRNWD